ncbi:AHH domain-containing protein [Corallincola holothuriorum]|nr:AHH domain-containing protein [Corallincola holothuriorum]
MKGESDYLSEKHKPNRLSSHMKATGKSRPPGVAAHAIVSGGHMEARQARKILAQWKIRIDDPDNGVFLPRNSKYMPHPELSEAPNHAKIHTEVYYVNVTRMIGAAQSEEDCRVFLRVIADQLQKGRFKF